MSEPRQLRFSVSDKAGEVSALLLRPRQAHCLLVLAHGAGAGMDHRFMVALAQGLAAAGVATLRYQFPYWEKGRRRPDPAPVLETTVRAAVATAASRTRGLPLFAGGKSMGGRMTCRTAADDPLPGVRGLVFFGFPLHAPGRPARERGEHLFRTNVPLLFLQGTRDSLADLDEVRPLCRALGERATLHVVEGADHSFHVLKRSGRTDAVALAETVTTSAAWMRREG